MDQFMHSVTRPMKSPDAPVADWEEWTGMMFPEDGEYVLRLDLSTP